MIEFSPATARLCGALGLGLWGILTILYVREAVVRYRHHSQIVNRKSPITNMKTDHIVRLGGNYAVQFHLRGYSLVADAEATRFGSAEDADRMARDKGMRHGQFTVETVNAKAIA